MKRIIATSIAIIMMIALAVPVMAADAPPEGTINSTTDVTNVVLKVALPTTYPIALDPLAISGKQVTEAALEMTNSTEGAAVYAQFFLDAVLSSGTKLVEKSSFTANSQFLITSTAKNLSLGIIAGVNSGSWTFAGTTDTQCRDFSTSGSLDFAFVLPASTSGLQGPKAAFTFTGTMEAYADWKTSDVSITGTYKLQAISTQTTVPNDTPNTKLGTAAPSRPVSTVVGFTTASWNGTSVTQSKTYTFSRSAPPSSMVIEFNFGGKSITSFKTPSGGDLVLGTDYTVQANSITITASRLAALSAGAKAFPIVIDGVTYYWNVNPT